MIDRSANSKTPGMPAPDEKPVPLDAAQEPDTERLTRYLMDNIAGLDGEIEYYRFTGGNANLTYLAKSADDEFVLKVEPPGIKAKSAHDMRREYRMLSSIAAHYPLAPEPVLLCEDESVFGGIFCVMKRVSGKIIRQGDPSIPEDNASGCMARRFLAMIDALATLHTLDIQAAGLADMGKPESFRSRQIRGWCRRFEQAATPGSDAAEDVIAWLLDNEPETPQRVAIIHNDFKMDNLVWDERAGDRLVGVLDWEMATVGDPLMDLACTLSFWIEEGDSDALRSLRAMPSDYPGIPSRSEAITRYTTRTGWESEHEGFYRCFALFRRAAIEQQKFHRFTTGQSQDQRYAKLDEAVRALLDDCRQLIST